jgi:hypothetical protein
VKLEGACGDEPIKRRQQLLEMLLWILEYPGRTPAQMANQLALADSTSRAYMCWLRGWIGQDADGNDYLPKVKGSRVALLSSVGSDHLEVIRLLGKNPIKRPDENLVSALDLVHGPVFADVPRSQWRWAEPLRYLLTIRLVDAATELIRRSLKDRRNDTALWAGLKGVMVCPWAKHLQEQVQRLQRLVERHDEETLRKLRDGEWTIWDHTHYGW